MRALELIRDMVERRVAAEENRSTRIEHMSGNGIRFVCERADLGAVIEVNGIGEMSRSALCSATAEFTVWHWVNIVPCLNGFSGYGHQRFRFADEGQAG